MPLHQIRLTTVIAAMVITLSLLLGGQYIYEKYILKQGLNQKVSQIVKVDEIKIAKQEKPPVVYIRASQIKDLQVTYRRLEKTVKEQLGPEYQIVLLDRRTSKLQTLFEDCQFPIQEAISTGSFQEMYQTVSQKARYKNVNYKISVDSYNVYVQFRDEEGYLYEIIPRWPQLAIGHEGLKKPEVEGLL